MKPTSENYFDGESMKDTSHQEEESAAMTETETADSVGRFLQQERLRQNKALKEVAEATRIHVNTIQALEDDDRSKLPAEVFVRGFISIYAQYLGLDVQEALNRYGRQTAAEWLSPETIAVLPGEESRSIRHLARGLVMICLAALLGYGGYQLLILPAADSLNPGKYWLTQEDNAIPESTEGELSAPEPAADDLADPDLPAPETPDPAAGWPQDAEAPVSLAEETAEAGLSPAASDAAPALPLPAAEPATGAAAESPSPLPGNDAEYVLVAEFTETTWLRIRIDDRNPAEYLFQPGQRQSWQARERISLFLGNAGGVDLVLNGQPQPKPGRSGRPAKLSFPGPRP